MRLALAAVSATALVLTGLVLTMPSQKTSIKRLDLPDERI